MAEIQVSSIDDLLFQIQQYKDEEGKSYPQLVHLLPSDNQIIDIDLSQRLIVAPHFLSVQYDHNAEVVYFKCDRYYDTMDLTNTVCLIQYKNAAHLNASQKTVRDDGLYWVPFYDIDHYEVDEEELLKRHKLQLQIYAEALEKLTGKKVKERLIYSFNLGKVINA